MTTSRFSGSERRAINRQGNIISVATAALRSAKSVEDCQKWLDHKNAQVRMLAWVKRIKLLCISEPHSNSEFDTLVERFRAEGKKDPIKSARASLAATARKRHAATLVQEA